MCNFFTYIRYIQQGLVRQEGERPLVAPGREREGVAVGSTWGGLGRTLLGLSPTAFSTQKRL